MYIQLIEKTIPICHIKLLHEKLSSMIHQNGVLTWHSYTQILSTTTDSQWQSITSCAGGRHNMPPLPETWPLTCANICLPRPLCSWLRPDVCDRQTYVRRASSLNAPYPRSEGIIRSGPAVRQYFVLNIVNS